ncbi:MAG: septum formation protein Maf [Planctomycetaceae bacterium]|nr:septum formation protein Maf [Planctomycetaceae bacterium]MBP60145.1 septum formation protein Maf [Planctomycetaceae bacterium]
MRNFPHPLILASSSPHRKELLIEAGYQFDVLPPLDSTECGICTRETPPEMVARLAFQKAHDVAQRVENGIVVGCDTVAECCGRILGKPRHREDAREMLRLLQRHHHHVYSGLCVWKRPRDNKLVRVAKSRLRMDPVTDTVLEDYLDSNAWQGKAGAFGLQDRESWIHMVEGSESNVIGLPLELLETMLRQIQQI